MKRIELVSAANAASNITSVAQDLGDIKDCSIHCTFSSGTLNGTLTLEASNNNTSFATVSGSSQAVASGAEHVFNVVGANYQYIRVKYTATSGTGTMTAVMVMKENPIKGA